MSQQQAVPVLVFGLDEVCKKISSSVLAGAELVEKKYDLDTIMDEILSPPPPIVLCGPAPEGTALQEVAQALRMQYQSSLILYMTTQRKGFDRKDFIKCGFTDAFMMPFDQSIFQQTIVLAFAEFRKEKVYRSVKVVDLAADTQLDFDLFVHLPANKKYVKLSSKGQCLDKKRSDVLIKNQVGDLHLPIEQMQDFYKFTAKQLKNLTDNPGLSETEKKERKEKAIRDLMGNLYSQKSAGDNIDDGRGLITDCHEIVKAYIMSSTAKESWYEKILAATNSLNDSYNHAANVSTFASLFSIGLGIGKPEEMALAGLLHDIGLVDIPIEIQLKSDSERTPEEQEIYKTHPQKTIDLIKERKMIVSDAVIKIILQHHERYDGKGYPRGLEGSRILPEAQLLSLANKFDYLTSSQSGKITLSLPEATRAIAKEVFDNPGASPFDPQLIKKFLKLFPEVKQDEALAV